MLALLSHHCLLSVSAPASCSPLVHLLIASHSPCQLVVALPLVVPPPPLVSLLSLVHLTHGSHWSCCLLSSLSPILCWRLMLPSPPAVSLHLLLLPPPLVSRSLSSLAGRLIVMLLRHLPLSSSSCCPSLCHPLYQGLTSGGPCPCIRPAAVIFATIFLHFDS